MIGKIFITSTGYDPELGKAVSDPYLGDPPTLGACRPDIRKKLQIDDHIFVISGKVQGHSQFIMAAFQVDEKGVRRFGFPRIAGSSVWKRLSFMGRSGSRCWYWRGLAV